jgi:CelD/BcsL family acetyltransferase involved in cellulose biosynthesis
MVSAGVEIVTDARELGQLEADWRSLAELRANAFVGPEWFRAWLDGMGPAASPFVTVVRRPDGGLRGLLPLVATTRAFQTLRFAGGDFADRIHPVAAPEDDAAVATAAASALFDRASVRTLLRLDHVEVEAEWVDRLLKTTSPAVGASRDDRTVLPYIDLRGLSWETFLATRSANFRSQLRRKQKGLERSPGVRFRRTVDSSELEPDLSAFFELHDKRWQALGGGSTLADPLARKALTRFARAAFRAGWLRLWFLEVEGRPAAAWYGWHLGGRYAYYQAGLDPKWSSSSLGFLLLAHTVRAAFEEGAEVYELLAGAEDFKRRFATGEDEVETIVVSRQGRPERAVAAVEVGVRRLGRRLPDGLRNRIRSLRGAARL